MMKKCLFKYAPDSEEKFELKKNGAKHFVLVAVANVNATLNTACELETKQFVKTPTKKSKTNINNNNNNNNKSPWSPKKKIPGKNKREKVRGVIICIHP